MEIRLFNSKTEFKKAYQNILIDYEPYLQLFLKNLSGADEVEQNNIIGGIYYNEKLVLLFLNAYPYNIQLFLIESNQFDAIKHLAKYVYDNDIMIRGVQGAYEECEVFKNHYYKLSGKLMEAMYQMDILVCDTTVAQKYIGTLMDVKQSHKDFLINAYLSFSKEALKEEIAIEKASLYIDKLIDNNVIKIYQNEENQVAACVAISELPNGSSVHFVYTKEEYRGRGYATNMMGLLVRKILEQKRYATLFVDQTNPISNKVYNRVGFKKVTDNYDYRIIS